MEVVSLLDRFRTILEQGVQELFEDNRQEMECARLLPSPHAISNQDLRALFSGLEQGSIKLMRGARFNTLDRPVASGRWGFLSREHNGCRYNAEYLAQVAAYVEAIHEIEYPSERVFFELPHKALKLDLAVITDHGTVAVLGEAKREAAMLDKMISDIERLYSRSDPGEQGRNESRQLAWRLWRTRAPYLWLIGPGERRVYRMSYAPLAFERIPKLPSAIDLSLAHVPESRLAIPALR